MGYLNKETVTVDAILTKRGRELLALGRSAFQITQFAVSDDEIDYALYDLAHPLGTEYYGATIENMPIIEASPDEVQNLRYKLATFERGLNVLPRISLGATAEGSLIFDAGLGGTFPLAPQTKVGSATSELDGAGFGYTLTLFNTDALNVNATPVTGQAPRPPANISDDSLVLVGSSFSVSPKDVDTEIKTQITITGNQSGATITVPVTIIPATR